MNRCRCAAYAYINAARNKDTTIDATKISATMAAKVFFVFGLWKFIIGLTSIFINAMFYYFQKKGIGML